MKIDKSNGNVKYNDEEHLYWDDNGKFISVTTLIGKFCQPFDSDYWSSYKAVERVLDKETFKIAKKDLQNNISIDKIIEAFDIDREDFNSAKQDILDEWQKKNIEACERGTKIHAELENSFYAGGNNVSLQKFGIGGKFTCKKDYNKLNLEYGVYPEYLIYYDNPKIGLHIAGQIDLLIKDGNDIILGDHKSNRKLDFKGFYNSTTRSTTKMKYPLTSLDDVNFNHYQLQLSTYAWMIQKLNPDFNIKRLFINHYDHEGNNNIYEVQYLKDEVEKMLKHFAKQQKLEAQKKKYERVIY